MEKAKLGDKVKIHFTCRLDNGTVFESTQQGGPMELVLGRGKILPEIEQTLLTMKPGESSTVILPPDKTFGHYQPELVTEIDQGEFRDRGIQPTLGLELDIQQGVGRSLQGRVTEFNGQKVRIDANHPLAGQTLNYDIQLVSTET